MTEPNLPPLTEHHLLPPGIHQLTLDQVHALFGQFQWSDRRPKLFQKLREFVQEVWKTGWQTEVLIDGSFVMAAVNRPEDIDIILVLPSNWDFNAELRPFEYNLVSKVRTRRKFRFDVFAIRANSPEETNLIDFFHDVNPKWLAEFRLPRGARKGIVRIVP